MWEFMKNNINLRSDCNNFDAIYESIVRRAGSVIIFAHFYFPK